MQKEKLHLPSMWPEWMWDSVQPGCAAELWPHQAPSAHVCGRHPEQEDLYLWEKEMKMRKRKKNINVFHSPLLVSSFITIRGGLVKKSDWIDQLVSTQNNTLGDHDFIWNNKAAVWFVENKADLGWQSSSDVWLVYTYWGLTEQPHQQINCEWAEPDILDGTWMDTMTLFSSSFPVLHMFLVISNTNSTAWDCECGKSEAHFELFTKGNINTQKLWFQKTSFRQTSMVMNHRLHSKVKTGQKQLQRSEKPLCHQCMPFLYHLKIFPSAHQGCAAIQID